MSSFSASLTALSAVSGSSSMSSASESGRRLRLHCHLAPHSIRRHSVFVRGTAGTGGNRGGPAVLWASASPVGVTDTGEGAGEEGLEGLGCICIADGKFANDTSIHLVQILKMQTGSFLTTPLMYGKWSVNFMADYLEITKWFISNIRYCAFHLFWWVDC